VNCTSASTRLIILFTHVLLLVTRLPLTHSANHNSQVIVEKSAADRKVIQDTLSEHYVFSDLAAKTISDVVDGACSCGSENDNDDGEI